MFAPQTAVLGTLLLTALAPGLARGQTASTSPAPATRQTPEPQSFPVAQPAAQPAAPAKPRNYLALLPAPPFNRTTIVIDPAHGGADNGSRISDSTVEKNVTLALAFHLRSLLTARGFNVVMTRDNDDANEKAPPFAPLTLDDRAGIANHERAGACLLLHATAAGSGVHLYTSELAPSSGETAAGPWLTAQAAWVPQSQHLAARLVEALTRSRIPVVNGAASVRPLDSLTCPALVLELAPHTDDPDSINDDGYQQRVAEAVAGALVFWKNTAQPPPHLAPGEPNATAKSQP
ncbi:MAG TPA: N-acetylmuramoyl-L-alanine amidase [Acidobacteriaceae bacterium]|jgi:N-acetylmuramoyl-L-alanine amidase|nr:N-acetylmuramoyl-L-alanine amidase [Acidobacteriaceae bacterium]